MTLKQRAMIFKALGHPARLAMVDRLAGGECCVRGLMETPQLPKLSGPTVSQHLLILKSAGIIGEEKRAKKVFYRLLMPGVEISNCVADGEIH